MNLDRILRNFTGNQHPDDCLTLRDLFENIFITGSTGTGKTSTLGYYLVKDLLKKEHLSESEKIGMIIFLYKSSDLELWKDWCRQHNRLDDLIVIGHGDKDVLNILDHYKDQEAINSVDLLMNLSGLSLGGQSGGSGDHYWQQSTRQRLHRLILLNQSSGEPLNIRTLFQLHISAPQQLEQLTQDDFLQRSLCLHFLFLSQKRLGKDHVDMQLLNDYFRFQMPSLNSRTQSSILSMTSSILEPFISSKLLSNLFAGGTQLNINELLRGKIVLLNLPIQKYGYSAKVAQIMFKYILQKQVEARDLAQLPNPVIFFMDEYQHYISENDFLFLSTARSARSGCVMITQNISNLYASVGGNAMLATHKVMSLLALANHKFFLAQNSFETNEFAAKIIGQGLHRLSGTQTPIDAISAGSASSSQSYHYQIMPHEFTQLRRGGVHHNGLVDCYLTATGKTFSNDRNWLKLTFQQPWMKKRKK